jgi:hypothetical protein
MENLYLFLHTVYASQTQYARGLRSFSSKDVSSSPRCIDWVLPSTLRWAS